MAHRIPYRSFVVDTSDGNTMLSAEASTLGFPPGRWPTELELVHTAQRAEVTERLELRQVFAKPDGEATHAYYANAARTLLATIFND